MELMSGALVVVILLAIFVLIVLAKTAVVVPQQNAYVVERVGRYAGTLQAGFHILIPFVDVIRYRHTLKEQSVDINRLISLSAFGLFAAQLIFAANFIWCLTKGRKADANPWRANSLEWSVPSPPPHGNFTQMPMVYRGPYEYASPESDEDYLPQDAPPAEQVVPEPELTPA